MSFSKPLLEVMLTLLMLYSSYGQKKAGKRFSKVIFNWEHIPAIGLLFDVEKSILHLAIFQ